MAISVKQRFVTGNAAAATTITRALATPTASSAIIVVGLAGTAATDLTFGSDTQGVISSTPVAVIGTGSSSYPVMKVWVGYGLAASAESVTINTGYNESAMFVFEVAGLAASNAFDKIASLQQSSATALSSTATAITSNANELVLGISVNAKSTSLLPTVGSGFSNLQTQTVAYCNVASEELITSTTGTQTGTFTLGTNTTTETTAAFTFSDTAVNPTLVKYNNAEGGTNGATVATSDTGSGNAAQTLTINNSGAFTFTNSSPIHGALMYNTNCPTTAQAFWDWTGGNASSIAARAYINVTGAPSSTSDIFTLRSTQITSFAKLQLTGAMKVTVCNQAGAGLYTFSPTLSTGTTYRLEIQSISGSSTTNGTISAQIFSGDSTTAIDTYTSSTVNAGTANFAGLRWGKITAGPSANINWDDIMFVTGTNTPLGPSTTGVTQSAAALTATTGTQAVASNQIAAVAQSATSLTVAGGTQVTTITGGSVGASIAQIGVALATTVGTQVATTTRIVTISQSAATITLSGGTQTVAAQVDTSVVQSQSTLTVSTGTPTVSAVRIASVSQVGATLALSGGTQGIQSIRNVQISQTGAILTLTTGTQILAAVRVVGLSQTATTLTATTGTQVILIQMSGTVGQVGTTLAATGGVQTVSGVVLSSSLISQISANLSTTTGAQSVNTSQKANITQVTANLAIVMGVQTIVAMRNINIAQGYTNIAISDGTQAVIAVPRVNSSIPQVGAALLLTRGTQTVVSTVIANSHISQIGSALIISRGVQIISINTGVLPRSNTFILVDGTWKQISGLTFYVEKIA